MLLNEDFIKVYEELESINDEELEEETKLTEVKQIPKGVLGEIARYIELFCEWTAKDFNIADDESVVIDYDTTGGADPHDEEVVNNLGAFVDAQDIALELDIEPKGKANIVRVYLDVLTM